jgi:hypothetical protein
MKYCEKIIQFKRQGKTYKYITQKKISTNLKTNVNEQQQKHEQPISNSNNNNNNINHSNNIIQQNNINIHMIDDDVIPHNDIEEYQYVCIVCESSYQRQTHLNEHLRSHNHQQKLLSISLQTNSKQQINENVNKINMNEIIIEQPIPSSLPIPIAAIDTNIFHQQNETKPYENKRSISPHQQVQTEMNHMNMNIIPIDIEQQQIDQYKNSNSFQLPSISLSVMTLYKLVYPKYPSNDNRSMIYQVKCKSNELNQLFHKQNKNTLNINIYALKTPNPWNLLTTKNEILTEAKLFYTLQHTSAAPYIRRVIGTYGDGIIYEWAKYSLQDIFEKKKYLKQLQKNLKPLILRLLKCLHALHSNQYLHKVNVNKNMYT